MSSPPPPAVATMTMAMEELLEHLLTREEELTHQEEALPMREAGLVASEWALERACMEHDAE
jgi:hypothetical protein